MDEEENKTDTKNILKELSGFTKAVENAISSVFSVPPTFGSLKKFPVNRIGGLQYPDSIDLSTEDYYCESVDSSTHKDLDKDFVKLALTAYCHVTGLVPLDAKFASLCIVKAFELNPCRESKDSLFNVMRSGQKSLESTFHFTKEGYRLSNYSERQELLLYSYLETHEVRSFNEFLKLLEDELKMNNQSKVAEGLKDKFFSRTKDASSIDSSDKAFQNILVWKKGKRLDVVLMDFVKVLLRLATKPEDHVIRELTTRKPSFPYTFQDNLSLGILKQLREEMIYVAPTVGWLLIALDYGIRHPGSNVINDKCKVIYNRDILLRMGYVGLKLIQQAINISKIPMYQEQNFTHCLLHDKTAESLHKVLEFRESSHLEDIKIEQLLPDADTKLSLSYILYVKMISTDFFYEYSLVQNKYLSFLYALLEKTTEGEIKDISDLTNHVVYKNLGSTVHKQMKDWANTIYKEKRNINSNFSCKSAFSNSNLALVQKEQRPLEKKILPVAPTVRVASDANYAPSLQQVMIHNDESDPQISMVNKKMTPDSGVLIINEDEFTKLLDMDDKYKKLILNALKPSQGTITIDEYKFCDLISMVSKFGKASSNDCIVNRIEETVTNYSNLSDNLNLSCEKLTKSFESIESVLASLNLIENAEVQSKRLKKVLLNWVHIYRDGKYEPIPPEIINFLTNCSTEQLINCFENIPCTPEGFLTLNNNIMNLYNS